MIEITNVEDFDNLLKDNENVVVKFGAEWCSPCKTLHPIMEELSNELNNIVFAEADVEEVEDLNTRYKIRNVPTTLIFKGGELKGKIVGAYSKADMREKINESL